MKAVLEWLCSCKCAALIRVYEEDIKPVEPNPYVWCVTVRRDSEDEVKAILKGMIEGPTNGKPVPIHAVERVLWEGGFNSYQFSHDKESVIRKLHYR